MLELFTEHIIHEILTAAGAGRYAIIYSGGGGFGLLLPNQEKTATIIREFAERLNEWSFDEFSGRFYIAMDVLSASAEKVASQSEFKELRQGLSNRLDRQKRKKFHKLHKKLFTPSMPEQLTVTTECQITRRDDLNESMMFDLDTGICMKAVEINKREDSQYVWVSESCYRQFSCGDNLIDAKCIVRNGQKPQKKGYFKFPDVYWRYEERGDDTKYAYYFLAESDISGGNILHINDWTGSRTLLYANYVRKCGDLSLYAQNKEFALVNEENIEQNERSQIAQNTASFTGLASSACGADLIGALRMDVDDMGDVFCMIDNPVELSAKSRLLNLFFKVYLNEICRASLSAGVQVTDIVGKEYSNENAHGKPGRNVSVIYAGGDDLFIVGAWDETTELAFDIQRTFEFFTQGGLTITGGLTLHQPKFPLYQMARRSAEAEVFAKHDIEKIETVAGKNRMALFFDDSKLQWHNELILDDRHDRYMLSMKWSLSSDFLIPLMKIYMQCGKRNPATVNNRDYFEINSFSYGTIEKWFSVLDKYHERHLLYLPTMARVLKGIEHEFGDDRGLFDQLVGFLYIKEENWIPHFHIALNWLTYLRRIT
jgi:CRISPR-associated protein Csm1